MKEAVLVSVCQLVWQCYSASLGDSHGLQYRQNAGNTTDDGTGVLSPGVVAAFGVIGAIAALVGIASTLIGIIIKVVKTIRDGRGQNTSGKNNGNQNQGEDSEDYHAMVDFKGVQLPTIDPSLSGTPRIDRMEISATDIHQIARCTNDQGLKSLALAKLSEKIIKWEDKQRKEAKPRPHPKKGSEKEHDNPPTGTSVERQDDSTESLKETAQDYYKKEHPDVTVQKMNKFLVDNERLIKGKPQYLLKHNDSAAEPDGLLHIVVVKSIEPELKENNEKYHQIQALLYAGGLKYCDYLQCSKSGDARPTIHVQHILPQENWKKTVVPKARKYCRCFDEMWRQVRSQHHRK